MKKKKKIRQGRVKKKKRDKSYPNFSRNAQKVQQKKLMFKTKGVEPNPKITSNALKVPTQYNPQTLFEPLILSFIAFLPLTMLQAQ